MKRVASIAFVLCAVLALCSCEKKGQIAGIKENVLPESPVFDFDNEEDFQRLFKPDYTRAEAEPEQIPGKLNLKGPEAKSGTKSASIIPGVRPLKEYKTSYVRERSAAVLSEAAFKPKEGETLGSDSAKSAKPVKNERFVVADWGPRQKLPAAVRQPSFYVVFSLPVKAVSALEEPSSRSEYMSISPAVDGVFRWYGSRHLAFEASQNIDPLQTYTITLSENLRSLSGRKLEGERSFSVQSEALCIKSFQAGYGFIKKNRIWVNPEDVIPEAVNEVLLTFNYPVRAERFASSIYAEIKPSDKEPFRRSCAVSQEKENCLLVRIEGDIPYNADIRVAIDLNGVFTNGVYKNADVQELSVCYHSLLPFSLKKASAERSAGDFLNPVYIYFSHDVDEKSVLGRISTEPAMPVAKDNIEVSGKLVVVHGLPVTFDSVYSLKVDKGIKDVYGRELTSSFSREIRVPEAASYVQFTDWGAKMLEAAYPHKMLFEYQNVFEPSSYKIGKTVYPLNTYRNQDAGFVSEEKDGIQTVFLNTKERNQRQFEVIDLEPLLENGRGWVRFEASVRIPYYWNKKELIEEENTTTIQVTDLGVTARYGANKAVVLVTSLSTGKPVEGASVYLFDSELKPNRIHADCFAGGLTDKNGLAVLSYGSSASDFFQKTREALFVEKEGDRAVFFPTSHDPWRSGVYAHGSPSSALEKSARTFIFSDRGLYKPGEKVTFRGIDRTQQLSLFKPYTGNYKITLKENTWREPRIIGEVSGTCSESGGFWGSFELPADTPPNSYVLEYERTDPQALKNRRYGAQSAYITVAHFERLKFQTEVSLPQTTLVSGENIGASLKASYLSGGFLTDASYKGGWVRKGCRFEPDNPALKHYRFGPRGIEYSMEQLSSFEGRLSDRGSAELMCTAAEEGIIGSTYRYFVEASVTDQSNQQVSTNASALVHPASVYIGIGKAENISGFAKKGQELTFPYILASADGNPLTSASSVRGDISVELIREDWKVIKQRGAGGSIYSSYEKENISEYAALIKAEAKGKVKIKPDNAGYHILVMSARDNKGKTLKTEYGFYVTGSGAVFWDRNFETSLRLTPDQSLYNPGDTARILLESPLPAGTYLITVEREGIFTEELRRIEENTSVLEIPVAYNYVPVVYVAVSSYSVRTGEPVHTYGKPDLDKPKGFFGVTEIFVNPRVQAFSIDIEADKMSYRPGEKASVTLTAKKGGKPLSGAELTLMAVDRGILDLINYHVPNPVDFFYNPAHFPLCVDGGDSRSLLMDPVSYEIKNLKGGDAAEDEDKENERKRFDPTAVFIPVLHTDKNGKVRAEFTLPDTLTTYRITAFGVHGDLLALHEDEIAVQNPLTVLPVMPRRLRERDTAECGLLLSNLDSKAHSVKVKVSVRKKRDETSGSADSGALCAFIDGVSEHSVTVESGRQSAVYFDVAALRAGEAELVFEINSPVLKEKLVQNLIIERPSVFETFTTTGTLTGAKDEVSEGLIIPSFADMNTGSLSLGLDSSRLGLLPAAVRYLADYPYHCMEQQASRLLPFVLFEKNLAVLGVEQSSKKTREMIRTSFASWAQEQKSDGGFPYWPGGMQSNFYVSVHLARIYAAAKKQGYTDKELAINADRLLSYISSYLHKERDYIDDYLQAYAAYVLSLNGRGVPDSLLTNLTSQEQKNAAVWALAGLTYIERNRSGDMEKAQNCAARIKSYLRPTTRGIDLSTEEDDLYAFWYANDKTAALASAMQLFVKLDKDDETCTKLLHTILLRQKAGYWKNTAVTARVTDAVHSLVERRSADKTDFKASVLIESEELVRSSFKGLEAEAALSDFAFTEAPLANLKRDTLLPLRFTKEGRGSLYYTASLRYALPQEQYKARDEGLSVVRLITDTETGKIVVPASEKSAVIELESGKTYEMEIRLSSGRDYSFVALRAPIPSGAEILDAAFVTTASLLDEAQKAHEDDEFERLFSGRSISSSRIYDNEVRYFWDNWPKGTGSVRFRFRAARRGVFPCPPLNAECMYESEIFGRTDGYIFVIK